MKTPRLCRIVWLTPLLVFAASLCAAERPNVVFFLADDISERTDLAAAEPDRAAALREELHEWQRQVGAKFPTPNENYDPAKPDGRFAARQPPAKP